MLRCLLFYESSSNYYITVVRERQFKVKGILITLFVKENCLFSSIVSQAFLEKLGRVLQNIYFD